MEEIAGRGIVAASPPHPTVVVRARDDIFICMFLCMETEDEKEEDEEGGIGGGGDGLGDDG